MTMATILSNKPHVQRRDKVLDVSISINESILRAIDTVRGDTNRSLWLRRLAVKELERHKKQQQKQQGGKVEAE